MRKLLYPLCIVFTASCGNREDGNKSAHTTKTARSNEYSFTGHINNKIPVSLWYTLQDSLICGKLVYTGTREKKPIRIVGYLSNDGAFIEEFLPDGMLSGIWQGQITGNSFTGTWTDPATGKQMRFSQQRSETDSVFADDLFTAGDITGSYNYNYGGDGGMGTVHARKLGSHVVYNIEVVGHAPGYNQAIVEDDTLELTGNTAIYTATNETGACSYRIRFFKNFLVIDSPRDEYDCEFGAGTTVTGIYLKTDSDYTSFHIDDENSSR